MRAGDSRPRTIWESGADRDDEALSDRADRADRFALCVWSRMCVDVSLPAEVDCMESEQMGSSMSSREDCNNLVSFARLRTVYCRDHNLRHQSGGHPPPRYATAAKCLGQTIHSLVNAVVSDLIPSPPSPPASCISSKSKAALWTKYKVPGTTHCAPRTDDTHKARPSHPNHCMPNNMILTFGDDNETHEEMAVDARMIETRKRETRDG